MLIPASPTQTSELMVVYLIVRLLNIGAEIKYQWYPGSATRQERAVNQLIKIVYTGGFISECLNNFFIGKVTDVIFYWN